MRPIPLLAVALLLGSGCAQQQGRTMSEPSGTQPMAAPPAPSAGSIPDTARARASGSGWNPAWWFDDPTRGDSGKIRACGSASAPDLLAARRQAIENARTVAQAAGGASGNGSVIRTITRPDSGRGYTVWVEIEAAGE